MEISLSVSFPRHLQTTVVMKSRYQGGRIIDRREGGTWKGWKGKEGGGRVRESEVQILVHFSTLKRLVHDNAHV